MSVSEKVESEERPVMQKPEKLGSREIYRSKILTVMEEQFLPSEGRAPFERVKVEHPGAAVILPQKQDGTLLLVRQYRAALESEILEFPAGTLEQNEAPFDCAKREIVEEVGFAAGRWHELGTVFPAPGFCDEKQFLFFATELQEAEMNLDEDELLEVVEFSVQEVEAAIRTNKLVDAKSICIFMRARLLGLV